MSSLKTQPTEQDPYAFIDLIEHPIKRENSKVLMEIHKRATGKEPVMWGDSIVGFGQYHYKYRSGHEGDWPTAGFSPRKQNLTIYIMLGFDRYAPLLKQLGKHKHSKSCLYINKLADVNIDILEQIIKQGYEDMHSVYDCQ